MKKFDYITALRWGLPILAILFVILCRYQPAWAEGYARIVYPSLSSALSAFSSLFPFSLEEILVVACILWILLFPIVQRRKGKSWKYIGGRELEMLAWIYVNHLSNYSCVLICSTVESQPFQKVTKVMGQNCYYENDTVSIILYIRISER